MSEERTLSLLGGTTTTVNSVLISERAWHEYRRFNDDEGITRAILAQALRGLVVRRMADNSAYWICEYENVRYVFVSRKHRKSQEPYPEYLGHFFLTNVQKVWKRRSK